MGCAQPNGAQGNNVARVALVRAGLPVSIAGTRSASVLGRIIANSSPPVRASICCCTSSGYARHL